MEPLSITASCISLTTAIAKTSLSITKFVRDVRSARNDLDAISRELFSLRNVLELLIEDVSSSNDTNKNTFPDQLQKQIIGIVTNCIDVVVEIENVLGRCEGNSVAKKARWVMVGSEDVNKLRSGLEAHKSALEIVLEMVALTMAKEIKEDTTELLRDTRDIKEQMTADTAQIIAEILRLQQQLLEKADSGKDVNQSMILERYLENLTEYAETVCDDLSDGRVTPVPDAQSTKCSSPDTASEGRSSHEHQELEVETEGDTQDPETINDFIGKSEDESSSESNYSLEAMPHHRPKSNTRADFVKSDGGSSSESTYSFDAMRHRSRSKSNSDRSRGNLSGNKSLPAAQSVKEHIDEKPVFKTKSRSTKKAAAESVEKTKRDQRRKIESKITLSEQAELDSIPKSRPVPSKEKSRKTESKITPSEQAEVDSIPKSRHISSKQKAQPSKSSKPKSRLKEIDLSDSEEEIRSDQAQFSRPFRAKRKQPKIKARRPLSTDAQRGSDTGEKTPTPSLSSNERRSLELIYGQRRSSPALVLLPQYQPIHSTMKDSTAISHSRGNYGEPMFPGEGATFGCVDPSDLVFSETSPISKPVNHPGSLRKLVWKERVRVVKGFFS